MFTIIVNEKSDVMKRLVEKERMKRRMNGSEGVDISGVKRGDSIRKHTTARLPLASNTLEYQLMHVNPLQYQAMIKRRETRLKSKESGFLRITEQHLALKSLVAASTPKARPSSEHKKSISPPVRTPKPKPKDKAKNVGVSS